MSWRRRRFLRVASEGALLVGASACRRREGTETPDAKEGKTVTATTPLPDDLPPPPPPRFLHGVASGDPLADRVIVWTRVEPLEGETQVHVAWVVALDPELRQVVRSGVVETGTWRDFTVKVDAEGLSPGTRHWYGFVVDGVQSPVGRTKTLPVGEVERARFAVASCSNLPFGFFTGYAHVAARDELDFVLHLGDYLYEYADGVYGAGEEIGRVATPPGELVSLEDYRGRHACYKRDADLQTLHAAHPMIAVWDDHELANNAYWEGAQNHQEDTQGAWGPRRDAAVQAYREWMPIREVYADERPQLYRRFAVGELFELFMLDTRLRGRAAQPRRDEKRWAKAERELLGAAQLGWLREALERSTAKWRVLGQQVLMAPLRRPDGEPVLLDTWDGYPKERDAIYDLFASLSLDPFVVLTGDIHSSWANELRRSPYARRPGSLLGVEFVTPGITSPGLGGFWPEDAPSIDTVNPHMRWTEFGHRGYLEVEISAARVEARWWHLLDVRVPAAPEFLAARFAFERDGSQLVGEAFGPPVAAPTESPSTDAATSE